jgi:hypothetical protein
MEKIKSLITQLKDALSEIEPGLGSTEAMKDLNDLVMSLSVVRFGNVVNQSCRRALCDFLINNGFTSTIDTDEYEWEKTIDEDHSFYCYLGDRDEYYISLSRYGGPVAEADYRYEEGFPELVEFLGQPIPQKKTFTFTYRGDFYDEDHMREYIKEYDFDDGDIVEWGSHGSAFQHPGER